MALIGKHIIFLDFPRRRKPPPRHATPCHASTPFCGVVMLTLEFDQLEVPCLEAELISFFIVLPQSCTVKPNIQQVKFNFVMFFAGGCPYNVFSLGIFAFRTRVAPGCFGLYLYCLLQVSALLYEGWPRVAAAVLSVRGLQVQVLLCRI